MKVVLCSLENAVDLDILESKLVSLFNVMVYLASERLKTRFADFDVDMVRCLFTIMRIVRPGMAGVGAAPLIK
jgi:hypothetical protein